MELKLNLDEAQELFVDLGRFLTESIRAKKSDAFYTVNIHSLNSKGTNQDNERIYPSEIAIIESISGIIYNKFLIEKDHRIDSLVTVNITKDMNEIVQFSKTELDRLRILDAILSCVKAKDLEITEVGYREFPPHDSITGQYMCMALFQLK